MLETETAVKLIKSVYFPSLIRICLFLLSQNSCDVSSKTDVLRNLKQNQNHHKLSSSRESLLLDLHVLFTLIGNTSVYGQCKTLTSLILFVIIFTFVIILNI